MGVRITLPFELELLFELDEEPCRTLNVLRIFAAVAGGSALFGLFGNSPRIKAFEAPEFIRFCFKRLLC